MALYLYIQTIRHYSFFGKLMTSLPIISQSTMIISMYVIGIKCLTATSTKYKRSSECASLSLPNVRFQLLSVNF